MKIIGIQNEKVEIKISDYQFPIDTKYVEDRNWLNVYLSVDSNQGKWNTIDPAITTSELVEIKDWLKKIIKRQNIDENPLEFIEPNLSFEYYPKPKIIRIKFDLEFRPKQFDENTEYYVDFHSETKNLEILINQLDSEILKFPIRI